MQKNKTITCHHNRPYRDEDPRNFEALGTQNFGGRYSFKCKHCNRIEIMNCFSEEGIKFMKEYDALNPRKSKEPEEASYLWSFLDYLSG